MYELIQSSRREGEKLQIIVQIIKPEIKTKGIKESNTHIINVKIYCSRNHSIVRKRCHYVFLISHDIDQWNLTTSINIHRSEPI